MLLRKWKKNFLMSNDPENKNLPKGVNDSNVAAHDDQAEVSEEIKKNS